MATACLGAPTGRARWTLELLADELVRLTEHRSISRETARRRLAENQLKPWRKDMWCIPQVDGNTLRTSMLRPPIRSGQLSALMGAPPN